MNRYQKMYMKDERYSMELMVHILTWQCFLRNYLSVNYPLYQIPDERTTFELINKSIYGGNCQVFKRHAEVGVNASFITGLDMTNLYGWASTRNLPYGKPTILSVLKCKESWNSMRAVANEEKAKSVKERYSSKCSFDKITNDPYDFTGFICCSIYFTKEQKEKMKYFPPLPEKETIGDDIVEKMVYTVKDKYEYYISFGVLFNIP